MPDNKPQKNLSEKPETTGAFATDVDAALLLQSPRGGRLILYVIILLVSAALAWSWFAQIDDVIKGQGKIIPSSHLQQIQNLEGGVLKEIVVKEGQVVKKGDTLMVLDDIQFSAELEKNALEAIGLQVAIDRLSAESQGQDPVFAGDISRRHPGIISEQLALARSRQENLQNQIDVLVYARKEKEQELEQLTNKLASAKIKYKLAMEEKSKLEPMLKSGAVSEMEVLQAKQKLAGAKAEMTDATFAIPAVKTAILEAKKRIDQAVTDFKQKARQESSDILPRYKGLVALQKSLQDKVARTGVKSPVHGTVKKIYIDTIGGTVRPGMTLIEIVPLDDKLLVETKVTPKDIGFIRHGQKAKVKLSAYDFAVYGGLNGVVERVSADSITDEKGRTYFIINVSVPVNYVGNKEENLHIIPGMQAEVDVVVTRRKIIDYVLRPLLKSKYN
jgi:adhesin transport system membrane fusion protein